MLEGLDGATRLYVIVGDPIAQVKSPAHVTRRLEARGRNAVVVPAHVTTGDLPALLDGIGRARNLDGIIVTVPHKFACFGHCATPSDRARFLGAVNIMRRNRDGSWHGEMLDGLGMLGAIRAAGGQLAGRRALLVGAGGAGSAIALELLHAGVAQLAVHDRDPARRDALRERLTGTAAGAVAVGSADPDGFDVVVNASPAGMRRDDPPPVQAERLGPGTFVADVITLPAVTKLVAAARARGCATATGIDMFMAELDMMVDFLLAEA